MGQTTIEVEGVPDEVLAQIDTEAAERGIGRDALLREWLLARFAVSRNAPAPSPDEARLLSKINEGFSHDFWSRYVQLAVLRNSHNLTDAQAEELAHHTEVITKKNSERVTYLTELAALRGTSVQEAAIQFGLRPLLGSGKVSVPCLGTAQGQVTIAEDFDAIPDEFAEYV